MKLVLNKCYGGFDLTVADYLLLVELGAIEDGDDYEIDLTRNNPILVECVEDGRISGTGLSLLQVVEIPDDVTDFQIEDDDGWETLTYVLNGKLGSA